MVRQDEFGRDILSDNDSDRSSRSRSPPRRRRRNSRSRSSSIPRHRRSRTRSRSPRRERGFERGGFERRPPAFERKHSYPPAPTPPTYPRPVDDYSNSIPFPPSEPPPLPLHPDNTQQQRGPRKPQIKPPINGVEPFKSFPEWKSSLKEGDDDSLDAYSAWQTEYVEKLKNALVTEASSYEWFSDRYNPMNLLKQREDSKARKVGAANSLAAMILDTASQSQSGDPSSPHPLVSAVSLSSAQDNVQLDQPPPLQGVPRVHNVKDRLVTIRKLPPWCSRSDLLRTVEAAAKGLDIGGVGVDQADQPDPTDSVVESIYLSDASKGKGKGYISTAWILYKDASVAAASAPSLGSHSSSSLPCKPLEGMEVVAGSCQEGEPLKFRLGAVELYRDRRPRFCPDMFSNPVSVMCVIERRKKLGCR
jgi:hypothetical protein